MPTYEYACKECGEHVEVVQSFKDDPLTECPACGGPLRKVFAPVGIVLKGSGFYKTDSRAAGGSKGATKEKKESSSTESTSSSSETRSDSSKADSKPKEKKAESKSA
ncbi:MAG: FmdB family transcriptional regulator [Acidimicrobiia bacterium]|nr:FmdB family transcriptional regulator [Acidimicrobiia bacterium]MBV9041634.1 FmdB family transcriptional regulator [Acidimicrobiia bacterium]